MEILMTLASMVITELKILNILLFTIVRNKSVLEFIFP